MLMKFTLTTAIWDCIWSHKNTRILQDIIPSHRIYCITQRRPNNIFMYLNLIILWNYNFDSLNFKNLRNLARHKFLKLREDDTEMSKRVRVNIICEDKVVVCICALVSWNKNKTKFTYVCDRHTNICTWYRDNYVTRFFVQQELGSCSQYRD
jgi:hypothetical protein